MGEEKILCRCRPVPHILRLVLAGAMIITSMGWRNTGVLRSATYGLYRDLSIKRLDFVTRNWSEVSSSNFRVRYRDLSPGDRLVAELVLEAADEAYVPVNELLNNIPVPGEKPLVVIYPDRQSLNKGFGWGADQSAMGVYWAGAIRVLDPRVWVAPDEGLEQVFKTSGPMAHEYAHLVVDYRAGGNYPRWFTEGIAQYVEREVTGFEFQQSSAEVSGIWYSLAELERGFDDLPDQNLAYRQALGLVDYLAARSGPDSLQVLIKALGRGEGFEQSLRNSQGISLKELEAGFYKWVRPSPSWPLQRVG